MSEQSERITAIVNALDSTPYGRVLREDQQRHRLLFEAMATSPDPMTREVGEQLVTGAATARQLLQHHDYQQFFTDTLTIAGQLDLERVHADIAALADQDNLTGELARDLHRADAPRRDEHRDRDADERR